MGEKYTVIPEKVVGKTVEEIAITDKSVVLKFDDNTFLDIYLDPTGKSLRTSTNRLKE
ncbi:hypothetical protein GGQ92_001254 [Gracilibacillus halotolerans]|uniref:Uncharacterized protein n=1 Tax=Gracilibacillus halotolerans TaxID=74386 RepID=A0A841RIH6_9BACI|nr:hypothetical protein [Gracilibacillus halotolerans]MBB6512471.1 hypothetical protein [Gracilibacillus halotolerans]